MNQNEPNPAGWILYDDACGFFRRWVPFWERTLQKRGFEIAPLKTDWVKEKLQLNEDDLLQDLRLLLASGETVHGADAYRYAMKRIWWAYPVFLFSIALARQKYFQLELPKVCQAPLSNFTGLRNSRQSHRLILATLLTKTSLSRHSAAMAFESESPLNALWKESARAM